MPKKKTLQPLPAAELLAILRAADDIIGQGGRTLLSKILKGSKEKKLLELELNGNPSYGYFKDLSLEQIMEKVDHMLGTGYLETEYSGRPPMIIFTPLGWAIERERRAEEFLQEWDHWLDNNIVPLNMDYLKERNRGLIFLFLYKILYSRDRKYIPLLMKWERNAYKKVQAEIRAVIQALKQSENMNDVQWQELLTERARTLIVRSDEPIFLACRSCGRLFIFDDANPDYYTSSGLRFPEECINCIEDPLWKKSRGNKRRR